MSHIDLDALLDGRLTGRRKAEAQHHLMTCSVCKRAYDSSLLAERALARDLDVPSPPERDAMLTAVLAEVQPRRAPRFFGMIALPAFAAATAGVLFVVTATDRTEFVARGGVEPAPAALRVFCAPPTGAPFVLAPERRCPAGAALVATVWNTEHSPRYVHFFVADEAGNLRDADASAANAELVGAQAELVSARPFAVIGEDVRQARVLAVASTELKSRASARAGAARFLSSPSQESDGDGYFVGAVLIGGVP